MFSAGSTTFNREDLRKGIEPDECYYIQNADRVRHRDQADLAVDRPPDLVIEVDIGRSSMNKHPIYGALGVPELWRCDGEALQVYRRRSETEYETVEASVVLPRAPIGLITRLMSEQKTRQESELLRELVDHVRG